MTPGRLEPTYQTDLARPAVVLISAGLSPPIRWEIRGFAALVCLPLRPRANLGCPPGLGDTGRVAVGNQPRSPAAAREDGYTKPVS